MYDSFFSFFLIFGIALVLFVFFGMRSSMSSATSGSQGTSSDQKSSRLQMVEDIKMTQTSRVVDQVAILDELSESMPNYRQYCELVGTAQHSGGVVAPYSRKQVAYYEIRCYRIENRGSGDVETLVAHEKSFDPFYFKDASCDTPIYVDINSFGDHVMLVNSTNHIEGPNSNFAKAVEGTDTVAASGSTASLTNIVGEIRSGIVHGFGRARDAVVAGLLARPAFVFAGAGDGSQVHDRRNHVAHSHLLLAADKDSGLGGFVKRGESIMHNGSPELRKAMKSNASHGGGGSQRSPQQPSKQPQVTIHTQIPSGLGTFLDTSAHYGGFSSVPRPMPQMPRPYQVHTYRRHGMGDVMSDMITGMVLSTVLDSMANASSAQQQTVQQPRTVFRGYRLVEDVVPLGSPVYCIGEIYHHGTDVYMARSLATDYPTSYFATRPEVEVLAALGAK